MAPTGKRTGESTRSSGPVLPNSAGYLDGRLLIAMPVMGDSRFERSVIYLCAHSAEGAMGIIVNHPAGSIDFPSCCSSSASSGRASTSSCRRMPKA